MTSTPPKQKGQLGGMCKYTLYLFASKPIDRVLLRAKANEENTVSDLKILSDDKAEKNEDEKPAQGSDPEPSFAGTTTNISGGADRGMWDMKV